jgi:hypothetical protein
VKLGGSKEPQITLATLNRKRYFGTIFDKFVSWMADFIKMLEQIFFRFLLGRKGPITKPKHPNQQTRVPTEPVPAPQKKKKKLEGEIASVE